MDNHTHTDQRPMDNHSHTNQRSVDPHPHRPAAHGPTPTQTSGRWAYTHTDQRPMGIHPHRPAADGHTPTQTSVPWTHTHTDQRPMDIHPHRLAANRPPTPPPHKPVALVHLRTKPDHLITSKSVVCGWCFVNYDVYARTGWRPLVRFVAVVMPKTRTMSCYGNRRIVTSPSSIPWCWRISTRSVPYDSQWTLRLV